MNTSSARNAVILTITISMIIAGVYGAGENLFASAKKPQTVIEWSNGFPSGEHGTINIHGKKLDPFFNCDNSKEAEPFGSSIFVPPAEINFVSNKRASGFNILQVLDPCADPFGKPGNIDPALIQIKSEPMQVYWIIHGKPNNGNGGSEPSEAMLAFPELIDACNFLPAFADDSDVLEFDIDVGLAIIDFTGDEQYADVGTNVGVFDAGDSIYLDTGTTDNVVDATDTLLYDGGNAVVIDVTALESFSPNEKHEDSDPVNNGIFDGVETVYFDVDDADDFVAIGDTRLANAITQGLPEDEGGKELDCTDTSIVGLGLVNNKGAFDLDGQTLIKFDETDPNKKGKKSKAVNITGLFTWSGVLCQPSLDVNGDGKLTVDDDFFGLTDADIFAVVSQETADVLWPTNPNSNSFDTEVSEAEFTAFLATLPECEEFVNRWIFEIADIVLYGLDYINNGSVLTQIRFYPVATL